MPAKIEGEAEAALESIDIYLIFVKNNPPQKFFSTVDMIKSYLTQVEERAKKNEWWKPIVFKDEEGNHICAYQASEIIGVVHGTVKGEKT